jgi:hypothetical protein
MHVFATTSAQQILDHGKSAYLAEQSRPSKASRK